MRVVKFGGSCLKEPGDLRKVIEIIEKYEKPLIVVVSALHGVTLELERSVGNLKFIDIEIFIETLFRRHLKLLQDVVNHSTTTRIERKLRERLEELKEKYELAMETFRILGEIPEELYDEILSYGERLTSLLLKELLLLKGEECEEVLPENAGLITDGTFGNAFVDLIESAKRLKRNIPSSRITIIPGFYGVSREGHITLLGKEGSDYSAAAIAYCVDADSMDVWKDVPGFMSGDPDIIEEVVLIPHLTYSEALELSYFGARIFHPLTMEPLMKKSIPIRLFNINEFFGVFEPNTIISGDEPIAFLPAKGVTFTDDIAVVKFEGGEVGRRPGILSEISGFFGKHGINIKFVITSQTSINVILAKQDLKQCADVLKETKFSFVEKVTYLTNLSLVAVVGEGIINNQDALIRILDALKRVKASVEMLSGGASGSSIYILAPSANRLEVVRKIHRELFAHSIYIETNTG